MRCSSFRWQENIVLLDNRSLRNFSFVLLCKRTNRTTITWYIQQWTTNCSWKNWNVQPRNASIYRRRKSKRNYARNSITGEIEDILHMLSSLTIWNVPFGNNGSNVTASWKSIKEVLISQTLVIHKFTHLVPVWWSSIKLTLMSESLRNDGRIWVGKNQ
jgi:hypothetical protein